MSDVEVTYAEQTARVDTARVLAALADALAGDGKVELTLGPTTMQVHVPDQVRCKVEVEIDRDELELEIELRWSTAPPPQQATEPSPGSSADKPDKPDRTDKPDKAENAAADDGTPAPKRAKSR